MQFLLKQEIQIGFEIARRKPPPVKLVTMDISFCFREKRLREWGRGGGEVGGWRAYIRNRKVP